MNPIYEIIFIEIDKSYQFYMNSKKLVLHKHRLPDTIKPYKAKKRRVVSWKPYREFLDGERERAGTLMNMVLELRH